MRRPLPITIGHWLVAKLRDREEDFYRGDPEGYERTVDLFDGRRAVAAIYADIVAGHFGASRPRVVLDQACGTGILSEQLARISERLVGLDMSTGMLELARGKNIANAEFVVGDFHDLGAYADGSIDAVTQFAASRYVSDDHRYHSEILRVLSPDGIAVISYYDSRGRSSDLLAAAADVGLRVVAEHHMPSTIFYRVGRFVGYRDRSIWVFGR